jgi:HrpA-like RNA helicase
MKSRTSMQSRFLAAGDLSQLRGHGKQFIGQQVGALTLAEQLTPLGALLASLPLEPATGACP